MKINILLISACLLFMASACTVNKRAHRPGYNVEWHSANPKPQKHPKHEEQEGSMELPPEFTTEEAYAETLQEPQSIEQSAASELLEEDNTIAGAERSTGVLEHVFKIGKSNMVDSQIDKPGSEPREKAPKQRNSTADNLAILGFVISIAFIWFPLGPLVAVILCSIALRMMRKNPTEHRRRGLAVAGKVIGIVALVLWSILLIGFWTSGGV
jgi:hypothetical protein